MFLLDWRLALFSLALLPFFVLLAAPRRRPAARDHHDQAGRDGRHLLARAGVAVGLAASCSARRWAAAPSWPSASSGESANLADLEVRSRMAGRWMMAVDPDLVRGHAGARLPVRRARARTRSSIGTDRRLHHAADAAVLPDPVAARRRRRHPDLDRAVRARLRVPRPAGRHRARRRASSTRSRGEVALRRRLVPLRRGRWTLRDIDLDGPGRHAHRARRRDRLGQDDARLPRRAAVRPRARARCASTAPTCAS